MHIARFILFITLSSTVLYAQNAQRPDALVLYRNGRYQEAVRVTLSELEENDRNMNAYSVLGWSLLALWRYEDAVRYGLTGLSVSPNDSRIISIVAEAYYYQKRYEQAIPYLSRYTQLTPVGDSIAEFYYYLGDCFAALLQYHKAEVAYSAAVLYNPQQASWWLTLGKTREAIGEKQDALIAYRQGLQRDAGSIELINRVEELEGDIIP